VNTTSRELKGEQLKAFNFWRALEESETATEARKLQAEMRLLRANREAREHTAAVLADAQENHEQALDRGDDEEFRASRAELQAAEDDYRQVEAFIKHYDEASSKYHAGVEA